MKKIYGYIAAAAVAGSLIISTSALAQTNSISNELEIAEAKATELSEISRDHLANSLERIRKIERTVTIQSRPSVLERSNAGRIHWYVLEEPGLAGR